MTKEVKKTKAVALAVSERVYLKQSDVPAASLEEAMRIPVALLEHYAGKPTSPLHLAKAMNINPKGSQLKVLTGAAIAFGLTEGGAQSASISVTELAKRILRPKEEGTELLAQREAILKPRVFGEFLRNYDGNAFPRKDIALNVLEDMGVPREKAPEVYDRMEASAKAVGMLQEIKGKWYVSLEETNSPAVPIEPANDDGGEDVDTVSVVKEMRPALQLAPPPSGLAMVQAIADDERRRKVFITHGKNKDLVGPIKKLLEYGELVPVVSVDRQSVSKPVPEKVMDDMRMCGAAIIHVDADEAVVDKEDKEHIFLNANVLIEIGAAMAFYGRRFILLVKDGVKLPSNLQGLYEVRYTDNALGADATIKLLEAIKDIKNYGLPTDPIENEA